VAFAAEVFARKPVAELVEDLRNASTSAKRKALWTLKN